MTANRWDRPPEPYPDPEPGTKARQIDDPVDRPEHVPDRMAATRADGTPYPLRGSLGMRDPADVPDEERVRWTPWP